MPSYCQYMLGFSLSQISSLPKSSIDCPLMQRYIPGAWIDAILITLFPEGSGLQSWLLLPVFVHWMTGDPPWVLSPAISSTRPLRRLWIIYPLPCLTKIHLWLNLFVFLKIMRRVSGSNVDAGTSRAFPEGALIRTQDLFRISHCLIGTILNIWDGSLGLKGLYLRIPSRLTALSPY